MNYEYKTVLGNVRRRDKRPEETDQEFIWAPNADLVVVDGPSPPEGDGWELVTTAFAPGDHALPSFVAREWRREVKSSVPAGKLEMPDRELVLDWIRTAHNRVEEQGRAKQKGIWQGDLDDAAAEYVATKLKELQEQNQ